MMDIKVPDLGEEVNDCLLTSWLKRPGDNIQKDEPLVEITTDKVTIEIPSEVSGTLHQVFAKEGEKVAVGSVICQIDVTS